MGLCGSPMCCLACLLRWLLLVQASNSTLGNTPCPRGHMQNITVLKHRLLYPDPDFQPPPTWPSPNCSYKPQEVLQLITHGSLKKMFSKTKILPTAFDIFLPAGTVLLAGTTSVPVLLCGKSAIYPHGTGCGFALEYICHHSVCSVNTVVALWGVSTMQQWGQILARMGPRTPCPSPIQLHPQACSKHQ